MEQLILLLQERNHYLEKFYDLNASRMADLGRGEFADLEVFYNEREHILGMIRHIDKVIEKEQKHALSEKVLPQDKALIQSILDAKEELVKQILAQDLQILSMIEREKSTLIKELSQTSRNRRAMGAYKYTNEAEPKDEEA